MRLSFKSPVLVAAFGLSCACSDPATAIDAAVASCDCPAAEPPLANRLVEEEATMLPIGGKLQISAGPATSSTLAECSNPKAKLLSGGCQIVDAGLASTGDYHLIDSFKEPSASNNYRWVCRWTNSGTIPADVKMTLTCLNPAQ